MSDTLDALFALLIEKRGGVNKACKYIAKALNYRWNWKYIYHVYRGTHKPSDELISKLNQLAAPPKPRYRRIFEALSKAQFDEWSILTMDDGREALDKAVKEKHGHK